MKIKSRALWRVLSGLRLLSQLSIFLSQKKREDFEIKAPVVKIIIKDLDRGLVVHNLPLSPPSPPSPSHAQHTQTVAQSQRLGHHCRLETHVHAPCHNLLRQGRICGIFFLSFFKQNVKVSRASTTTNHTCKSTEEKAVGSL